VTVFKISRLL